LLSFLNRQGAHGFLNRQGAKKILLNRQGAKDAKKILFEPPRRQGAKMS
jgi:hypothetical protein